MIRMLAVLLMFVSFSAVGGQLSPVLDNCFDDEDYCYQVGVVFSPELGRKVIRVNFNARLDAQDFESYQEVAELFLDFEAWETDYLPNLADYSSVKQALMDNVVVVVGSKKLEPIIIDGVQAYVHYSHCWSVAPWPLSKMEVVEKVIYLPIDPYDGAVYSLKFFPDKTFLNTKGLKHKTGELHIAYDEEEETYVLHVTVDVIAEIDFLPTVAAPYVGKTFVTIFEAVFSEYL